MSRKNLPCRDRFPLFRNVLFNWKTPSCHVLSRTALFQDMLPGRFLRLPVDLDLFQDIDVVQRGSGTEHD
jgi:hypothetical protein